MMLNIAMSITPFSRSSLERASVFYVGQYSMQITVSGGSEFSANQHDFKLAISKIAAATVKASAVPTFE
jgi:hypothetical protein